MDPSEPQHELAHPDGFREPTAREHRVGAAIFLGFSIFFVLFFVFSRGWWFRWVLMGLAMYSFLYALRQWRDARSASRRE